MFILKKRIERFLLNRRATTVVFICKEECFFSGQDLAQVAEQVPCMCKALGLVLGTILPIIIGWNPKNAPRPSSTATLSFNFEGTIQLNS